MVSSPPRPLTRQLSFAGFRVGDVARWRQAADADPPMSPPDDDDGRRAGGAVDDDGVGLAVAGAAAACPRGRGSTLVTPVPVRSLTVMVSAPPRASTLTCSTPLTSMVTLPTSRKKPQPAAVGREVDVLVDVGAVEEHRVVAVLALDGVAAVAGVPDEGVVAGAHEGDVVAAAAGDDVVAVAADQHVVALAAGDACRCRRRRRRSA